MPMLRRKRKSSTDLRPEVMMTMVTKMKKARVMKKKQTMATMVMKERMWKSGLLRTSYNQVFKVTGSSVRVRSSVKSTTMSNLTTS
jgi:hypothetical protein